MGLLNPQNFIYGISLALLVLIYLRSRSRPTIEVSSLMLFDEAPAPVASVRHVRLDLLFWLEMLTLAALTLAVAGLYVMRPPSSGQGRSHALVFDLGAGMSARDASGSRLDQARRDAIDIINQAPAGDQFSVIAYALEAQVRHPPTANLADLRKALADLVPMAVPARTAALRAALIRARGASEIDLFADRPPAPAILADVGSTAVNFHQVGSGDSNLAIVSLDPGIPGSTRGRAIIRNFSAQPHPAEVAIDLGNTEQFHQTMMLAPREQVIAGFGPLSAGGLLRARILTTDAIEADNNRYAYAPSDRAAQVLVLSPDAGVRDDIARVLLAVNVNFQIEAADPAKYVAPATTAGADVKPLELAVMHDCYLPGVKAASTLLIYPPHATKGAPYPPGIGISVDGTIANADVRSDPSGESAGNESLMLGATRIVAVPEWMDLIATATGAGHASIPLAAFGRAAGGPVGVLAFDVRDHLLLAPDHLDALVMTVDLVKQLTAPPDTLIVSTGADVSVPATGTARVTQPDGNVRIVTADKWGRVRIRPMQAGRYTVDSGGVTTQVLANYYDAVESDLAAKPQAEASALAPKSSAASSAPSAKEVQPLVFILIALALLALMIESAMLIGHTSRWRMRHV